MTLPILFQMVSNSTIWCKERRGVGIPTINQIKLPWRYLETVVHCRPKNSSIRSRSLPPSRYESDIQIKITSYHHILGKAISSSYSKFSYPKTLLHHPLSLLQHLQYHSSP